VTEGRPVPLRWRTTPIATVAQGTDEIDLRRVEEPPGAAATEPGGEPVDDALLPWVTALVEDVLDRSPIRPDEDLFDLGLESHTAARLHARIARETGAALSNGALYRATTVAALTVLVRDAFERGRFTSLVALQPGGTRPPFFCVHGGAGTVLHLRPLSRALGRDQPFYAFQAPGLLGHGYPVRGIRAMARRYVDELRAVQPSGPYLLGGYCFGSIVAWEMIRLLEAAGEEVAVLVVFNGPTPEISQQRLRDERARSRPRDPYRRLRRRAGLAVMDGRRALHELQREGRIRLAQIRHRSLDEGFLQAFFGGRCWYLEQHHHTGPWSGRVVVFRGNGVYEEDRAQGWGARASTVVVHEITGVHTGQRSLMAEPHASALAPLLAAELARAAAGPAAG
jgi:thioesterase domain-containing protein/aryl carrier-like protein